MHVDIEAIVRDLRNDARRDEERYCADRAPGADREAAQRRSAVERKDLDAAALLQHTRSEAGAMPWLSAVPAMRDGIGQARDQRVEAVGPGEHGAVFGIARVAPAAGEVVQPRPG